MAHKPLLPFFILLLLVLLLSSSGNQMKWMKSTIFAVRFAIELALLLFLLLLYQLLLLLLLLFVTLLFSLTARIAFRYCCCCCWQRRMQQISRRNARTARKSFERRRRSNSSSSSRQRRQQGREQLSKWHICCGSHCGCLCRRQLQISFRLRLHLHLHLSLQVTVATVACGKNYAGLQGIAWRCNFNFLSILVLVLRFYFSIWFIYLLLLFFRTLFTCTLGTHLFEALCVCVCVSRRVWSHRGRGAKGEGRVAPGADVNVDDGKAPLGSSDCTRAAETNETMWMRDQSQS